MHVFADCRQSSEIFCFMFIIVYSFVFVAEPWGAFLNYLLFKKSTLQLLLPDAQKQTNLRPITIFNINIIKYFAITILQ